MLRIIYTCFKKRQFSYGSHFCLKIKPYNYYNKIKTLMQDQYVSLNPANTVREEKAIRSRLYQQRLLESQGGNAAVTVGTQWGLTASVLTYSMCRDGGFRFMPLSMSSSPGYVKIASSFVMFYVLGHSFVNMKFGDKKAHQHLWSNRSAIMSGEKNYDRED